MTESKIMDVLWVSQAPKVTLIINLPVATLTNVSFFVRRASLLLSWTNLSQVVNFFLGLKMSSQKYHSFKKYKEKVFAYDAKKNQKSYRFYIRPLFTQVSA